MSLGWVSRFGVAGTLGFCTGSCLAVASFFSGREVMAMVRIVIEKKLKDGKGGTYWLTPRYRIHSK